MGKLTEFLMKAPPPPAGMGFAMPMMKGWVPRRLQPWIYVLTALCFQFSGGIYLGALDEIRGTTNFMIEDVMFLLYATLAGMAVWFPMLFRMKFRFTNQQLLCTSAIVMGICNVITMHSQSMPVLMVACFIAGIAKIQGTFECMSNIQLWITPKRDFAVFFPVLHIILLTAIEGSGWLAAWMGHHFTWQMMHAFTVGTMSFVLLSQIVLCRPFCPMPNRFSLKGTDWQGALLICVTMLLFSYIFVYGDHYRWFANRHIRMVGAFALIFAGLTLYRLIHNRYPYVELRLLKCRCPDQGIQQNPEPREKQQRRNNDDRFFHLCLRFFRMKQIRKPISMAPAAEAPPMARPLTYCSFHVDRTGSSSVFRSITTASS